MSDTPVPERSSDVNDRTADLGVHHWPALDDEDAQTGDEIGPYRLERELGLMEPGRRLARSVAGVALVGGEP